MRDTITIEDAEDIVFGTPLAVQHISSHRWYDTELVVFDSGAGLYGFHYLRPKTEMQEGQDRFEEEPVPIFPVVAKEITVTVYDRVT